MISGGRTVKIKPHLSEQSEDKGELDLHIWPSNFVNKNRVDVTTAFAETIGDQLGSTVF